MATPLQRLWDAGKTVAPMEIGSIAGGALGGLALGNIPGAIAGSILGAGAGGLVAHHQLTQQDKARYSRLTALKQRGKRLTPEQQKFIETMAPDMTKESMYLVGRMLAFKQAGMLR